MVGSACLALYMTVVVVLNILPTLRIIETSNYKFF